MRKSLRTKLFFMVGALAVLLVFAGICQLAAQQTKITAKGGKPGKPPQEPALECNNNGICEDGEYDLSKSYEDQPCPDCAPKSYGSLDTTGSFVLGLGPNLNQIFQFRHDGSSYVDKWTIQDPVGEYDVGDFDSDGTDEIIIKAVNTYSEGKNKKKITYYEIDLAVFEPGSNGDPYLRCNIFAPSTENWIQLSVVDADNDGYENEIILVHNSSLKIFRWDGSDFANIWTSPSYPGRIYRYDFGDADADGENEIVCAMFREQNALVIDHLGDDEWGNERFTEKIEVGNPDISFIAIDQAIPCDADNDGYSKEIIAGGNNGRLMVWALVDGTYKTVAMSDYLGFLTQGISFGNFDGDDENEIVVGTWESNDTGTLNVLKLISTPDPNTDNQLYELKLIYSVTTDCGIFQIRTGDVNFDSKDEVYLTEGVVFEDNGSGLTRVFNSCYLHFPRLK